MKKPFLGFIFVGSVAAIYLFLTDFGLVKKFVGYNAPEFKEPETVSVDGGELSF